MVDLSGLDSGLDSDLVIRSDLDSALTTDYSDLSSHFMRGHFDSIPISWWVVPVSFLVSKGEFGPRQEDTTTTTIS